MRWGAAALVSMMTATVLPLAVACASEPPSVAHPTAASVAPAPASPSSGHGGLAAAADHRTAGLKLKWGPDAPSEGASPFNVGIHYRFE